MRSLVKYSRFRGYRAKITHGQIGEGKKTRARAHTHAAHTTTLWQSRTVFEMVQRENDSKNIHSAECVCICTRVMLGGCCSFGACAAEWQSKRQQRKKSHHIGGNINVRQRQSDGRAIERRAKDERRPNVLERRQRTTTMNDDGGGGVTQPGASIETVTQQQPKNAMTTPRIDLPTTRKNK